MFEAALLILGWTLAGMFMAWRIRESQRLRDQAWLAQLPAGLLRLSGQLRTGLGVDAALSDFCRQSDLAHCAQGAEHGLRWEQLLNADDRAAIQSLGRLVSTHRELGNDLGGAVEALAERWSARLRAAQSARVAMAPVLAQARLLAVLMPVLIAMVGLFEPQATLQLFTTYSGLTVLVLCMALNAVMWSVFRGMAGRLK